MPGYDVVSNVFAVYASVQDERTYPLLEEVFTEDATFTIDITGGPTIGPYENRDALVEFISTAINAQTDQRRHVITNVRVDGDVAYAILSLFVTDSGELTVQATGVYRVDLVEEADGTVRFSSMHLLLDRPY